MGEHRKSFWIIGIALIIFLILLLGSIIGLYLVRRGIDDALVNSGILSGDMSDEVLNYQELEDGTKENISEAIRDAEFDVDGIKLSHFTIQTATDGICTITAHIENLTEENIENKSFFMVLKDSNDEVITKISFDVEDLVAQTPVITVKSIDVDCANAATIEMEEFGVEVPASGDMLDVEPEVSGDATIVE